MDKVQLFIASASFLAGWCVMAALNEWAVRLQSKILVGMTEQYLKEIIQ